MGEIDRIQKDEFSRMIHEAKAVNRKDKKDTIRIKNKPILKQRFVQLYIAGNYTNSQIASIMCISKETVKNILREPEILDMIMAYQDEEKQYIDTRLKAIRHKSLDTITELLDSEDDSVRLNAAKEILDRTGHVKKEQKDVNINISYEERLNELASSADLSYIDTSYADVINDELKESTTEGSINNGE